MNMGRGIEAGMDTVSSPHVVELFNRGHHHHHNLTQNTAAMLPTNQVSRLLVTKVPELDENHLKQESVRSFFKGGDINSEQ